MSVAAVGAIVGAVTAVAGVGIQAGAASKANKFAQTQASLNNLTAEQLNNAQMAANDRNAKIKIIADTVANVKATQAATAIQMKQTAQMADTKNKIILTLGGGVILITSVYFITRK